MIILGPFVFFTIIFTLIVFKCRSKKRRSVTLQDQLSRRNSISSLELESLRKRECARKLSIPTNDNAHSAMIEMTLFKEPTSTIPEFEDVDLNSDQVSNTTSNKSKQIIKHYRETIFSKIQRVIKPRSQDTLFDRHVELVDFAQVLDFQEQMPFIPTYVSFGDSQIHVPVDVHQVSNDAPTEDISPLELNIPINNLRRFRTINHLPQITELTEYDDIQQYDGKFLF